MVTKIDCTPEALLKWIMWAEIETLIWVDWFNNRRLLEPVGDILSVEYQELYYRSQEGSAEVVGLK